MKEYKCDCNIIHEDKVEKVLEKALEEDMIFEISDFFKILGDPTRVKIIHALIESEELCVCDIANILGMSQSAISHQLRVLKQGGFAKNRRDGKVMYYSIDDEHISEIFNTAHYHIKHRTRF